MKKVLRYFYIMSGLHIISNINMYDYFKLFRVKDTTKYNKYVHLKSFSIKLMKS